MIRQLQGKNLCRFVLYIVYSTLLLVHLATFTLTVIFYSWCLYNDKASVLKCSNFDMYKSPFVGNTIWAATKIPIGLLATLWTVKTETYRGVRYVWQTLKRMPHFWNLLSLLVISSAYSINEIAIGLHMRENPSLSFFVFELLEKVVLGPLPCLLNCTKAPREFTFQIEQYFYVTTLVMFSTDNMFETLASSLLSVYKLATIPEDNSFDATLINLVLMVGNIAYRKVLWDFYWLKLWRGDKNLFGTVQPSLPE